MVDETQQESPILAGLSNLGPLRGRSDEDKSRAILAAGLSMLEPRSAIAGSGFLEPLGEGVTAGLQELDTREDRRFAQGDQLAQRGAVISGAAAETQRADAATTASEARTLESQTGAAREEREGAEFAATQVDRDAVNALRAAEAAWLARRYSGEPAGSQAAELDQARVTATVQSLMADNPDRYRRADGTANQALALVDAYKTMGFDELLKNDALAVILENAQEGQDVQEAVAGLTPSFQGEDTRAQAAGPPTIRTQEEFDAAMASGQLKTGDTFLNADGIELKVP